MNKQQISTQAMVITSFEIIDNRTDIRYFKKTFFIANIPQHVVLGMHFLKLRDLNVSCTVYTLRWGQWYVETALMTTNLVIIINPEDFIHQVLEKSSLVFIYHVITWKDFSP